ncbi:MAG: sigma-70 family RNA polymerase sigma factor [Candidatus Margulisbacteria bacterium]|jgi:RNA polymerase sigma factor for flagellar operon FliA|nr:sigma-70 family RNA polymerase sigma factor [Candidatus Margulisiibacteriota bacterium]
MWILFTNLKSYQDKNAAIEEYRELITTIARTYKAKHKGISLDVEDLAQDGFAGLAEALEKYDPARGVKFLTFALYRITGAMLDDIRKDGNIIRQSQPTIRAIKRLNNAEEYLGGNLNRLPTDAELARYLGWDLSKVDKIKHHRLRRRPIDPELFADGKGGSGQINNYWHNLPDEQGYNSVLRQELRDYFKESIEWFLPKLNLKNQERNRYILRRCCRIIDRPKNTFAAIGKETGLTETRVSGLFKRYRKFLHTHTYLQDSLRELR